MSIPEILKLFLEYLQQFQNFHEAHNDFVFQRVQSQILPEKNTANKTCQLRCIILAVYAAIR